MLGSSIHAKIHPDVAVAAKAAPKAEIIEINIVFNCTTPFLPKFI